MKDGIDGGTSLQRLLGRFLEVVNRAAGIAGLLKMLRKLHCDPVLLPSEGLLQSFTDPAMPAHSKPRW